MDVDMNTLLIVITCSLLAGLAMALGAVLAYLEKIDNQWIEDELRHGITAFGGGALLSAVALVLVPEGIANLKPVSASIWFLSGVFLKKSIHQLANLQLCCLILFLNLLLLALLLLLAVVMPIYWQPLLPYKTYLKVLVLIEN